MTTKEEITDFGKRWYIEDDDKTFHFALYIYDDDPDALYLSNVYVSEENRRKGFGNLILKIADDIAKNMNVSVIMLKARRNSFVHDWYERNGFVDFQIDSEDDGFIWMKKELNK